MASLHGGDGQTSSCGCRAASQLIVSPLRRTQPHVSRGSSHKTEDVWGVSHPGSLEILHMQNFWGISALKAFGMSLHLESVLPMQNLRGVSAPRISGVYPNTKLLGYHCTSGAFLHPKPLGPRALSPKSLGVPPTQQPRSISHPGLLGSLCSQSLWNISHPKLLGCLTPRALEHWPPQAELQRAHTRGGP